MPKIIFVFGSNLAGRHGAGSAKFARSAYYARYGVGQGRTGDAYAIPTKNREMQTLPLEDIKQYVDEFVTYANAHPELEFRLVAIGCGLAGYKPSQIAPMFGKVPRNVILPSSFLKTNPKET